MLRGEENSSTPAGATVFKDDRKRAYLNPEGADRPLFSPIPSVIAMNGWGGNDFGTS